MNDKELLTMWAERLIEFFCWKLELPRTHFGIISNTEKDGVTTIAVQAAGGYEYTFELTHLEKLDAIHIIINGKYEFPIKKNVENYLNIIDYHIQERNEIDAAKKRQVVSFKADEFMAALYCGEFWEE